MAASIIIAAADGRSAAYHACRAWRAVPEGMDEVR